MPKQRLGFDLVLLGDPASGKDTQAKLLAKRFALKLVESGNYLRGLQKNRTPTGKLLREKLAKGLPAPSSIIKEFLSANIRLAPKDRDLLFVGNPRLVAEAEFLVRQFARYHRNFFVLYLTLPIKEIEKRSEHRMRNADDTKFVQVRIRWHQVEVSKTIKFFQKKRKLKFVYGKQTIKQVNQEILRLLKKQQSQR